MKKNIVALAVASAIAAPVAMADAPTVYGQINMALEQASVKDSNGDKYKADSGTQVNSRNSRIGIKGASDLGNGLKAVYKAEFKVNIDSSGGLGNRNQYVGLAGGFGTVLMGRHDTPMKMIQAKDLFNDAGLADNKPISGGLGALGSGGEVRASNVLAYVSPSFGGVKLMAAFVPKEDGSQYGGLQNNAGTDQDSESSLDNAMSFAAMYGSKKKGLYLAAAYNTWDKQANVGGNPGSVDELRVTAQYTIAGLIANAMYQDFSGKGLKNTVQKGTNIQANVGYKIGNFMPKVKISLVDRDKNAAGDKYKDSTNYALGLDYSLGKKTTAYVEYAMLENQGVDATTRNNVYGVKKAEQSAFSIGLLHKF
ncbi:porin [Hydrogenovibrio thermophilus]|uniref:Porin n=1 Tax=Hydrogenovibrio thermophilus TaxID=265883 RepID=A0A451G5B5_9GAMM|nr:porin [Hydrogenovibrio thermophilus]QAB14696.1 porin [Hydrogenovibrio thermophilus]